MTSKGTDMTVRIVAAIVLTLSTVRPGQAQDATITRAERAELIDLLNKERATRG